MLVPLEVQNGILALPVAFSAGRSLDQAEREIQAKLYLEAIEGYPVFIAEFVLRRIRLFNPRNPFPPTPQDVREHCDRTLGALKSAVLATGVMGEVWSVYSEKLPLMWFGSLKEVPFSPGCVVPDQTASEWVREHISCYADVKELKAFCEQTDNYYRARCDRPYILQRASPAEIRRLPKEILPDDFLSAFEIATKHFEELRRQHEAQQEIERKRYQSTYGTGRPIIPNEFATS